ncbi:MAG TPA: RodZ domain-containing protein [Pseudomonadales bacterium]
MSEEEREPKGPGATLREARERMQISTRQVAEALNLPVHTIEAIEAEDPERLPAPVFARGYTRAYARLLELDADAIVAQYPQGEDNVEQVHLIREPRSSASVIRFGLAALLWILGLGVVAVVVWVVWQWSGKDTELAEPVTEARGLLEEVADQPVPSDVGTDPSFSGVPQQEDAALTGREAAEIAGFSAEPEPEPESVAQREVITPRRPGTRPETEPTPSDAGAMATQAAPVEDLAALREAGRRITSAGDDVLRMEFFEDCWVEVMSSTGSLLYGDLNRSGRVLVLVGEAPFRVLLGYAPGVRMSFNGEAVVLTPHTRNAVADLVLGQ